MTNNIQTYQITCWVYWIALSNEQGNTVEQLRYTAWGVRVNPYTWKPLAPNTTHILDRGYTGHEHLDGFDLINMKVPIKRVQSQVYLSYAEREALRGEASTFGRIYDPVLCRFLSPDNYVQNTTDPQNFNKYSYVLNNPLRYTDPSGELTWWDIGAGVMIAGGIVLTALGQGQFGVPLIISGADHFIQTHKEMQANPDMSWDEASDNAGLIFRFSIDINKPKEESIPDDNFSFSGSYNSMIYNNGNNSSGGELNMNSLRPRSGYGMSLHESIDYYSYQQNVQLQVDDLGFSAGPPWHTSSGDSYFAGGIGAEIRGYLTTEFGKAMFDNYWFSHGNVTLSDARFNDIVNNAGRVLSRNLVILSNGHVGVAQVHSFYGNNPYAAVLGAATIYYQGETPVGFQDSYDFNWRWMWGSGRRTVLNELKTRAVSVSGWMRGATPFNIIYGIRP